MFARSLIWIDSLLILININEGYARTYADEFYGRIRGSNQATSKNAGVIFLIIFGCLVGGFFICCICGTLILGCFDNRIRYMQRKPVR
ncbi:unnamed protein product [Adineta steineri]|uniref:Uncharacterized protein n=1 Tax=Adineta steineri TaxID=433720 RepID=A0A815F227_9BILA|nr:unnamed protein product [Adineta steineri]CAF1319178.1 unnamed protein product [Adineta steineri]